MFWFMVTLGRKKKSVNGTGNKAAAEIFSVGNCNCMKKVSRVLVTLQGEILYAYDVGILMVQG